MGAIGTPTVLDAVLALLFAFALVRGWRRGAVLQVAAFAGLVVGLFAGVWAAPWIAGLLVAEPGPGAALLTIGVLVVAVLVAETLAVGLGRRVHGAVHRAGVGTVDRAAGIGAAAIGFLLVVWLLANVLAQGPVPALAQQVRSSVTVRALESALPPPPDVVGRIAGLLDQQGFPQVFAGPGRGITAPPLPATADEAVRAAAVAGQPSTVQIRAFGCGATIGFGSGFVTRPGFVVTNAHVVAGFDQLRVGDAAGERTAVAIHFDPALDIAVLAAPEVAAPPIGWTGIPARRGTQGATLGFPGGQSEMVVLPATVLARLDAIGRDIYGGSTSRREILTVAAGVQRGDSGGPFVTAEGLVAGVVFAGDPGDPATGYALTAEHVRPGVERAITANQPVAVGGCRF
ncbi:acid resistance serine protease MarP [Pseudonocardia yuanmonensis]|uniref:Acid resistance serine protease MarP n=1 Tax=Pseudonocardia yuanmonensis TaxID=1095914 RepID=A0ABP8W5M1_9PSEU